MIQPERMHQGIVITYAHLVSCLLCIGDTRLEYVWATSECYSLALIICIIQGTSVCCANLHRGTWCMEGVQPYNLGIDLAKSEPGY